MKNHQRTISNERGQVALFIALIFQVLFVFFAMIVNVGLLVHHKINLQNSVDLAAYYGATKQAEMMNAIGHINYQIRQSWKLFNFRYNQLGSAGAIGESPNYAPFKPNPPPGVIQFENDGPYGGNVTPPAVNAFCIPYSPVEGVVERTENYCKDYGGKEIPLPTKPAGVSGLGAVLFSGLYTIMGDAADKMRRQAIEGCERVFAVNWMTLASYIQLYKIDIRNRKQLLFALANSMSKADPLDLDGESMKKGVYKTLLKNLTMQSQESMKSTFGNEGQGSSNDKVQFEYLNSLTGDCGEGPSEIDPPKWLSEIFVFPIMVAAGAKCNGETALNFNPIFFNAGSDVNIPDYVIKYYTQTIGMSMANIEQIREYVTEFGTSNPAAKMYRTSMGVEKNPWCVAYTGVSAKVTPKIPFSPLGDVTLTARAFAKPFGGRIGPWYSQRWENGDPSSKMSDIFNPEKLVDKLLPIRVDPANNIQSFNPAQYQAQRRLYPNHSRYLGDNVGVTSNLTMSQFGKAIHGQKATGGINLGWTAHTFKENFDERDNGNGDPLMWDDIQGKAPTLRDLEIAAIAPDQFDISTYSIDPDFYTNYLTRIKKGYESKLNFMLRGDLGSRMKGSDEQKRFGIRKQIEMSKNGANGVIDTASKLTYYINKLGQVLTGWQQKSPDSYVFPEDKFAKCGAGEDSDPMVVKENELDLSTQGSCRAGGRTGYSVKLVDGKFLSNQVNGTGKSYELGGVGVFGDIKNSPEKLGNSAFIDPSH